MHWLMAAMSSHDPAELRGLRPRDARQAHWSQEWARLERETHAAASISEPKPWWKAALRPALRWRIS
jgi:hypothetical protein